MILCKNDNWERFDHWLLEIECDSLQTVIINELMSKHCIELMWRLNAVWMMQLILQIRTKKNMLSFVRILTKKSLYSSLSTLMSIRKLKDFNKTHRLCIIYDKDELISWSYLTEWWIYLHIIWNERRRSMYLEMIKSSFRWKKYFRKSEWTIYFKKNEWAFH